ncbi:hypothetical protein GCM10007216_11220 [Thalassobacillus devorans]|uniref:DUF6305 domain-containing protein n=1 Tax=Thalassobacillus devorans TaxID=279813 RepID=A0ABQ1NPS8_9BACI|nr:DUF6305 family protein [Thalassobacillus devorans]NIK28938.1 hypothetical protein [Thalassobacillus devorans]GGC82430.1 hypothetical protein GCM10007216_11220 [Thalassobacillus devorans]
MKKYSIILLCFVISLIVIGHHSYQASGKTTYMYPNLPAPIGKEPVLITSAGQTVEGGIVHKLAQQLHLDAEYRPRALATDLYEYETLVIVAGYSYNGLLHKNRRLAQEKERIVELMKEAEAEQVPVVIFDLDVQYRDYEESWEFLTMTLPYADYFIGKEHEVPPQNLMGMIHDYKIKSTFVNEIEDMKTPFNSVFR